MLEKSSLSWLQCKYCVMSETTQAGKLRTFAVCRCTSRNDWSNSFTHIKTDILKKQPLIASFHIIFSKG